MRARLEIDKLVYGGDGLARHEDGAVFVPFVLPGEEVDAELSRKSAGVRRGVDTEWISRSDQRSEPPCPVFAKCGGCHYQHMPHDLECSYKVGILRETLSRIGGIDWDADIPTVRSEAFGYRNRTQIHFARQGRTSQAGFLAARSHRLVASHNCAINSPKLNELHRAVERMAADRRFPSSLKTIEFFTDEDQVQVNLPRRAGPLPKRFWAKSASALGVDEPGTPLDYRCGEDSFQVSGRSFFQVNRFLAHRLAELAIGTVEGRLAIDLYAGVGLFTLPLARRFREVVAVDSAPSAMRDLRFNARRAGCSVRAVHLDVDVFLDGFSGQPDLIVADPPRTGLGAPVVSQIVRLCPPRLHLVSCDPATLARDLKLLLAAGYALLELQMVDLFPQTYHIETVAILERRR
ncbi:MAG: class I SAM-dependent RNA methyltransferase [Bryobacterales bacterium]|nr:class I SAM-dependent RNA methyltransferase [Bryobacterales bacterium]MDE0622369.1 class I SAM-dependent RNA methyltransferase [Bryobacterales bacterium]